MSLPARRVASSGAGVAGRCARMPEGLDPAARRADADREIRLFAEAEGARTSPRTPASLDRESSVPEEAESITIMMPSA